MTCIQTRAGQHRWHNGRPQYLKVKVKAVLSS